MLNETPDSLELARQLMRTQMSRRRDLEKELEIVTRALERVSVSFVETIEHLQGVLETTVLQKAGASDMLRLAVRQAIERLDDSGIGLDGKEGELFDPGTHRAIQDLTTAERGELRVVKVLARGITCAGRRFKPAGVIVRKSP